MILNCVIFQIVLEGPIKCINSSVMRRKGGHRLKVAAVGSRNWCCTFFKYRLKMNSRYPSSEVGCFFFSTFSILHNNNNKKDLHFSQ